MKHRFSLKAPCAIEAADRLDEIYRPAQKDNKPIPLHAPWFIGKEQDYVNDCLDNGWVSSVGAYVERFEQQLANATGTGHAVAVVNGTAALHALLHALDIGPGDAVICPALTFVATANAVLYTGATPVICDIDPKTLGLCPDALQDLFQAGCSAQNGALTHKATGAVVKAVVLVHIFGHPVNVDAVVGVCAPYELSLIEDAAESLGSLYKNKKCGSLGTAGIVSFNGNKITTTGGGCAIVTNDTDLADKLKHLTTTARIGTGWEFDHDAVGFNYRLPNLNAALGCAQLEQLDRFVDAKRRLSTMYKNRLSDIAGLKVFQEPDYAKSNYWLNAVIFDNPLQMTEFIQRTNERSIQTRPCWTPIPRLKAYRDVAVHGSLRGTYSVVVRLANIPSGPELAERLT